MKVLLIGEVYSENLGDPLLCGTVEHLIRQRYPDAEIVNFDMSGMVDAQHLFGEDGVSYGIRTKWDKLMLYFRVYADKTFGRVFSEDTTRYVALWCSLREVMRSHHFDLAVFAGGALFMDYFAGSIYLIAERLAKAGIPTVFHACGMGMLHADQKELLNTALCRNSVVSISLRDGYDQFLSAFSVGDKAKETFDTALNCCRFYPRSAEETADYGVGLIANENYFDQQVTLVKMFQNSKLDWKVFTNGASYDEEFALEILHQAGLSGEEIAYRMTERPTTAQELTETVTQFRNIVSFRMHSQIAAASFGIPCYGIAWDRKLQDFYTKLGFPNNVSETIISLDEIRTCLKKCEPNIYTQASDQAKISKEDLYAAMDAAIENHSGGSLL